VIRTLLHRFSRGKVLKRRLPAEFGRAPIFVSPESALPYWKRDLAKVDPFLLSMVRELVRPGMNVWDVGANVGLFAFAAAGLGARVVAVEADPWLAHLLQCSAHLNGLPVTVVSAAAAAQPGSAALHISPEGRASNSLVGDGPARSVTAITLDGLLENFPAPDVLKIDVEGAEYAVLEGARRVLEHKPVIFSEVSRDYFEIGTLLRDAGYQFYAARSSERIPLRRPSRDTLAIAA